MSLVIQAMCLFLLTDGPRDAGHMHWNKPAWNIKAVCIPIHPDTVRYEPSMEATGLVLALAGLFNNALECFEYIRIGQNFDTDFQTLLLQLDVANLRLSRWGEAVGLNNIDQNGSTDACTIPKDLVSTAEELLTRILRLLDQAQARSRSLGAAPTYEVSLKQEPMNSLHSKLSNMSLKRQGKAGLRQRAAWALRDKKELSELITQISGLINDLETLFPALPEKQKQICQKDVAEIESKDSLDLLRRVSEFDRIFQEEISKALTRKQGTTWTISFHGENRGNQVGQNSGNMNGFTIDSRSGSS